MLNVWSTRPSPSWRRFWPGFSTRRTFSWSDRRHAVYGDEDDINSGGHLHGLNRPDKTEFPPDWDDDTIVEPISVSPTTPTEQISRLTVSGLSRESATA